MLLLHRHVYAVYVYENPVHKVKSINLSLLNSYFQWLDRVTCWDTSNIST
jgi:hypothetical protein